MTGMCALKSYPQTSIARGKILLCGTLALLVTEVVGEPAYSLLIISGYKAGLSHCYLPIEASDPNSGISTEWLIQHWQEYGVQGCAVEDVQVLDEIDALSLARTCQDDS